MGKVPRLGQEYICAFPADNSTNSAHFYSHTLEDPARESRDLGIGQGDAALRPVESVVYASVPGTEAVDTEVTAKRGVLGRWSPLSESKHDPPIVIGVDAAGFERPLRLLGSRIVDTEEEMKSR